MYQTYGPRTSKKFGNIKPRGLISLPGLDEMSLTLVHHALHGVGVVGLARLHRDPHHANHLPGVRQKLLIPAGLLK